MKELIKMAGSVCLAICSVCAIIGFAFVGKPWFYMVLLFMLGAMVIMAIMVLTRFFYVKLFKGEDE